MFYWHLCVLLQGGFSGAGKEWLVTKFLEFSHQEVTHYLVKWCSLPYEESTWELEEDVDPAKVKEFESLQVLPEVKHVVMCLCVCLTPLVTR